MAGRYREPAGQTRGGNHRIRVVDVDQLVDPRHDENHGDEQAAEKDGDHGHGLSSSGAPRPLVQTGRAGGGSGFGPPISRTEEHTSALQSLMRTSYVTFSMT